jgi:hypothetical protein
MQLLGVCNQHATPFLISDTHTLLPPYSKHVDLIEELKKCGSDEKELHKTLSRFGRSALSSPELMLNAIEVTPLAYLYADPKIKTDDFALAAIERHPCVFDLLTDQQVEQQTFVDAYRTSFFSHNLNEHGQMGSPYTLPTYRLSSRVSGDKFFSPEAYREAYQRMVRDPSAAHRLISSGPYGITTKMSADVTFIALAHVYTSPDVRTMLSSIERDVILENAEALMKATQGDIHRGLPHDSLLRAAVERCPELASAIANEIAQNGSPLIEASDLDFLTTAAEPSIDGASIDNVQDFEGMEDFEHDHGNR